MLDIRLFLLLALTVALLAFGISYTPGEETDIDMAKISEFVRFVNADEEIGVLGLQERFEILKQPEFLRSLCDYFDENTLGSFRMALGCLVALNMQKYPKEDVERFAEYVYGRHLQCFQKHIYLYYAFLRYFGKRRFNTIMEDVFEKYKRYLSFYVAFPCARLPYLTEMIDRLMKDDHKLLNDRIEDTSDDDRYNLVYIMTEEQLRKALTLTDLSDKARQEVRLELLARGDLEQLDQLQITSYILIQDYGIPTCSYCGFEILFDTRDDFTLNCILKGEMRKRIASVKAENLFELPLRCIQTKHPDVLAWSTEYYKQIAEYLDEKNWMRTNRFLNCLEVDYRKYSSDINTKEYLALLNEMYRKEQVVLPVTEKTMAEMTHLIDTNSGRSSLVFDAMCEAGLLPVLPHEYHAPWVISTNSVTLSQNTMAFYTIFKDMLYWNEKRLCYEWANEPPKELQD